MGDPKGFMKYSRKDAGYRPVEERIQDFGEVEQTLDTDERIKQNARCMDCGIPFCNWHCSLGNLIPEFQDFVSKGDWRSAYDILSYTCNFPEFTGRICPALCEHSCVLARFNESVTIRENEVAIAERAFFEGYVKPKPPAVRTGKKVAVVGSGPAGLCVADDLNKLGHTVTLFEKDDAVGGLLRYGIPDFKLNKFVIDRRMAILIKEGLIIKTNTLVGKDIPAKQLLADFDAVCICTGAMQPRDLIIEGRDLRGIHFAMDFLTQQNRINKGAAIPAAELISAKNKNVLILGGGDTGADCVGTSNRQGAKSITQVEIMPKPPDNRTENNPWPYYAYVLKTSSSHLEGCNRLWSLSTKRFIGEGGNVKQAEMVEVNWTKDKDGKMIMSEVPGKTLRIDADLVLLALGFVHPVHKGLLDDLGVKYNQRGNILLNITYQSNVPKVFAAGDSACGASLVLKAMADGKKAAKAMHNYLMEDK